MDDTQLKQIIEAALMAADNTLSVDRILQLFELDEEKPTKDQIKKALTDLQNECEGRGIELKSVASGFRYQTRSDIQPWVARLWHEKPPRYTRALLETLALIIYRQPITRGEIEEVRGVSVSSNIIKTLLEREWIKVVGHKEVPGRPALYSTTKQFLDYFNIKSLSELPSLAELTDLDQVHPEFDFSDTDTDAEANTDKNSESDESSETEESEEDKVQLGVVTDEGDIIEPSETRH